MKSNFAIEMLLVLPVPFRKIGDQLYIEKQAHHGVRRWLDSFSTLAIAAPVIPEYLAKDRAEISWVRADNLPLTVLLIELPWAYRPDHFILNFIKTRNLIAQFIDKSRYLQFAIGGLWGDWALVGALIASKRKRKYSIHTDRVEHEVILFAGRNASFFKKIRIRFDSFLMKIFHRKVIYSCSIGLFHGMDTWNSYHGWLKNANFSESAFCVHNIHDEEFLTPTSTNESKQVKKNNKVFNILYAGRFVLDKAPLDWLKVIHLICLSGKVFEGAWIGDGPMRPQFEEELRKLGLETKIKTPGFIDDRILLSKKYIDSDIFLFTHITPESPRCLLEALRLGLPIVGYDSPFARDLISKNQGGVLVPCGDFVALAESVQYIYDNPDYLIKLKDRALKDGARFSSKKVFGERSFLIKKYS